MDGIKGWAAALCVAAIGCALMQMLAPKDGLGKIFKLMLGAFFMATDYVSSPSAPKAQLVFGIGCGVVTMVVRLWGGYPEGVSFSILFMNLLTPLLDKALRPKVFGEVKQAHE